MQLLLLLQEFPDNPNYINYMVDALYEKSSVLKVPPRAHISSARS